MKRLSLIPIVPILAFLSLLCAGAQAASPEEEFAKLQKIANELRPQAGEISIAGDKIKISLTKDFRYLNPSDTRKLLVDVWGNPPENGETAGAIVPADADFLGASWAALLDWKQDGYIKDEEFDSLDFKQVIEQLKVASRAATAERVRRGYGKMEVVGWATPPHYDKAEHKLYWAKAFDGGRPIQELNYDIRILGRAGVLELSIISSMDELKTIEEQTPEILSMVNFTSGNRYADYKPGDHVAEYTIGGLIGTAALAKAGFFKGLMIALLKGWKLVLIAVAAIGAGIAKFLGRKKHS